jgi:hypothetical protein
VEIPVKIAEYEYVKLRTMYETDVKEGELIAKAYRRAWKIAETAVESKVNEYLEQISQGR